jgi:hypothetical protein
MTKIGWPLVEIASRLLEHQECEAVLGDLVEANEGVLQGLLHVLGLFLRRQAVLWKGWRPWLAGFGVALPSSLLLIGVSVSVSCTYERLTRHKVFAACSPTGKEGVVLLLCHVFLLIAWSWTGGFVVASVSRRTLWVSSALCASPCLFCLARFREASLSRLCLVLFLLPAILGAGDGLRIVRIRLGSACALAVTVTALMIFAWSSQALWILNWVLIWPAWYLVVLVERSGREGRTDSWRQSIQRAT